MGFIQYYSNPNNFVIDSCFRSFAEKMIFFSLGRDHKFRPVLYLYPVRLQGHMMPDFEHFVNVYLSIIQKYVFKPYFIENWVMIIDAEKKGVVNFPWKALKSLIEATNVNFASRMHKLYILNPSFLFYATWKIIKNFIDPETVKKLSFLKKKDFGHLQECIPKNQLLKAYGGDLDLPKTAYPIPKTLDDSAMPRLTSEEAKIINLPVENSYKEVQDTFISKKKIENLIDFSDDFDAVTMETRSLKVFLTDSQLSREMTRLSAFSISRRSY